MAPPHAALLVVVAATAAAAAATCGSGTLDNPNRCIGTVAGQLDAGSKLVVTRPRAVAVSSGGLIAFMSMSLPQKLLALTPTGQLIDLLAGAGENSPSEFAFGPDGSLYYASYRDRNASYRDRNIWRLDNEGVLSIVAGSLDFLPYTIAVAPNGDIIAAGDDRAIRRVSALTGAVSIIAGNPRLGTFESSGDGGPAVNATFDIIICLAVAENGDILFADRDVVRRVSASTGVISTIAGNGNFGAFVEGAPALNVSLGVLRGLAVSASGEIFLADSGRHAIFRVSASTGMISRVAGSPRWLGESGASGDGGPAANATLDNPSGVAVAPNGDILIADTNNNAIRRISAATGTITTISGALYAAGAGAGVQAAVSTALGYPRGVAFTASGDILIADTLSFVVRRVNALTGAMTVVAGRPGNMGFFVFGVSDGIPATSADLWFPSDVAEAANGDILFSSYNAIYAVSLTGIIWRVAGSLYTAGASGDGGPATSAALGSSECGVAVAANGDIYIADPDNSAVRRVSAGIISSVAGTLGVPGMSGDGGPAVNATLRRPTRVAVSAITGNILISDSGNCAVRLVNVSSGVISTVAGLLGECCGSGGDGDGDGGPAVSTTLCNPDGVAFVAPNDDFSFADNEKNVIRYVSASSGVISTIVGKCSEPGANSDGGLAINACLSFPTGVAVSASGTILIADTNNNVIRIVPMSELTKCPPGFFCSVGRNLKPCTDAAFYCPQDSAAPLPVNAGYIAVGVPSPFDAAVTVYTSQRFCPKGHFCPIATGTFVPCFSGSFGVTRLALTPVDCTRCAPATFLAETGRAALASGASPCLPCPAGSVAPKPGAAFCSVCAPNTFRATSNASNLCSPCPSGTASLYGASSCFALGALDALSLAPGSAAFQRLRAVVSGNAPASDLSESTLRAGLPVVALALLPYVLLALACALPRAFVRHLHPLLERVDRYKIRDPDALGASPYLQPSPLGGALTVASVGFVLVLMLSTVVQYAGSNTLLQQSTLPVTLPALASFRDLPLARVDDAAAAGLNDTGLLALTGPVGARSGFSVTVAAMGSRCGVLRANSTSWSLVAGAFVYSVRFDAATGAALHSFACANCFVDGLSQLELALDASCQSLLVTVAAAGVAGGVSSASIHVANEAAPGLPALASAAATVALALEVIQDSVSGAKPRAGDGLLLGGRSAAGYVAMPATDVATVQQDATVTAASSAEGAMTLTLALPAQPAYTLYALSPILSLLALFSSLAAWLTLLGAGSIALDAHERGASLARRLGCLARERGGKGEKGGESESRGRGKGALDDAVGTVKVQVSPFAGGPTVRRPAGRSHSTVSGLLLPPPTGRTLSGASALAPSSTARTAPASEARSAASRAKAGQRVEGKTRRGAGAQHTLLVL
jgi:sugar lactone lactonase YvrE